MPQIGKKISQLRKLRKLTQKEFAQAAEINYRHFQDIEADKANIRVSTALNIAEILKVPVQVLFDEDMSLELIKGGIESYGQALDRLPIGVFITNLDGKVVFHNNFFRNNFTCRQEIVKSDNVYIWDLLPNESVAAGKERFFFVIKNLPEPQTAHHFYLGPNQKPVDVTVIWNYMRTSDEILRGLICSVLHSKDCITGAIPALNS